MRKYYFTADDVGEMLGVSKSKAYEIIKNLNEELERDGYIILPGKVPSVYLAERWYGFDKVQEFEMEM